MPRQLHDLAVRAQAGKLGRCRGSLGNSRDTAAAVELRLLRRKALLFEGGSVWRFGLCK